VAPTPDPASAQEARTLTGAELRALREARGWTQAEVGRRAGVLQVLVSLVERDKAASWNVEAVQRALTSG
jgi:transcriptional regulator with XRE-family HTH domain